MFRPMLQDQADSPEAVSARLERVRSILGMSKRDFAHGAGLSEQSYTPYSKGTRPVSLEAAKKFRSAYGITLEFLYFGNDSDLPHRIAKQL